MLTRKSQWTKRKVKELCDCNRMCNCLSHSSTLLNFDGIAVSLYGVITFRRSLFVFFQQWYRDRT